MGHPGPRRILLVSETTNKLKIIIRREDFLHLVSVTAGSDSPYRKFMQVYAVLFYSGKSSKYSYLSERLFVSITV